MKNVLNIIKQIILANWIALIGIVIMSIMLAVGCDFNFILGFVLLTIAYFVLGFAIESFMAWMRKNKRKKQGKTDDQIKKEEAIRASRRERGKELIKNNSMSTKTGYAQEKSPSSVVPSGEHREIIRRASRLKFEEPTFDEQNNVADNAQNDESNDTLDSVKTEKNIRIVYDTDRYKKASGVVRFDEGKKYDEDPSDVAKEDDDVSDDIKADVEENTADETYDEVNEPIDEPADEEPVLKDEQEMEIPVVEDTKCVADEESDADEENVPEAIPEIDEMAKNSEDISKAVADRVAAPRRRRHIIFDLDDDLATSDIPEANQVETSEDNSDDELDYEFDSDEFDDDMDDIPTADSVSVSDGDIDELFAASHQEEKENSGGFFKKALSSLKKKRRERRNKRGNF